MIYHSIKSVLWKSHYEATKLCFFCNKDAPFVLPLFFRFLWSFQNTLEYKFSLHFQWLEQKTFRIRLEHFFDHLSAWKLFQFAWQILSTFTRFSLIITKFIFKSKRVASVLYKIQHLYKITCKFYRIIVCVSREIIVLWKQHYVFQFWKLF